MDVLLFFVLILVCKMVFWKRIDRSAEVMSEKSLAELNDIYYSSMMRLRSFGVSSDEFKESLPSLKAAANRIREIRGELGRE
jgi:hypothetical protein